MCVVLCLQITKAGVVLTGVIPYSVTMEISAGVCNPSDELACADAYHGWSEIDITLSVFYESLVSYCIV